MNALDLRMHSAIDHFVEIRLTHAVILKTKPYYNKDERIMHYKTHIWDLIEINTEGLFPSRRSFATKKLATALVGGSGNTGRSRLIGQ